jgi:hypothetical protein
MGESQNVAVLTVIGFGSIVGLAMVFLPPVRRFTLAYQHG